MPHDTLSDLKELQDTLGGTFRLRSRGDRVQVTWIKGASEITVTSLGYEAAFATMVGLLEERLARPRGDGIRRRVQVAR